MFPTDKLTSIVSNEDPIDSEVLPDSSEPRDVITSLKGSYLEDVFGQFGAHLEEDETKSCRARVCLDILRNLDSYQAEALRRDDHFKSEVRNLIIDSLKNPTPGYSKGIVIDDVVALARSLEIKDIIQDSGDKKVLIDFLSASSGEGLGVVDFIVLSDSFNFNQDVLEDPEFRKCLPVPDVFNGTAVTYANTFFPSDEQKADLVVQIMRKVTSCDSDDYDKLFSFRELSRLRNFISVLGEHGISEAQDQLISAIEDIIQSNKVPISIRTLRTVTSDYQLLGRVTNSPIIKGFVVKELTSATQNLSTGQGDLKDVSDNIRWFNFDEGFLASPDDPDLFERVMIAQYRSPYANKGDGVSIQVFAEAFGVSQHQLQLVVAAGYKEALISKRWEDAVTIARSSVFSPEYIKSDTEVQEATRGYILSFGDGGIDETISFAYDLLGLDVDSALINDPSVKAAVTSAMYSLHKFSSYQYDLELLTRLSEKFVVGEELVRKIRIDGIVSQFTSQRYSLNTVFSNLSLSPDEQKEVLVRGFINYCSESKVRFNNFDSDSGIDLSYFENSSIFSLGDAFGIDSSVIEINLVLEALKESLYRSMAREPTSTVTSMLLKALQIHGITEATLDTEKVRDAVYTSIRFCVETSDVKGVRRILTSFPSVDLSPLLADIEFTKMLHSKIQEGVSSGFFDLAFVAATRMNAPVYIDISNPDTKHHVVTEFASLLYELSSKKGPLLSQLLEQASYLLSVISQSDDIDYDAFSEDMYSRLSSTLSYLASNLEVDIDFIVKIAEELKIPNSFLRLPMSTGIDNLLSTTGKFESNHQSHASRYLDLLDRFPDFREDFEEKLSSAFVNALFSGHFSFKDWKQSFRLTEEFLEAADLDVRTNPSFNMSVHTILGHISEPDFKKHFPKTLQHALDILPTLLTDSYVANAFLVNLDYYAHEPWAPGSMLKAIEHPVVAKSFVEVVSAGKASWVLDPWVDEIYIKAKETIANNRVPPTETSDTSSAPVIDSFNIPQRSGEFTSDQFRISLGIAKIISGDAVSESVREAKYPEEALKLLARARVIIEKEHAEFIERFRGLQNVPIEDVNAVISPTLNPVSMTDLRDSVSYNIARYLTQSLRGDFTKVSSLESLIADLGPLLKSGYEEYILAYMYDIPYYDRVYAEFDEYRAAGRFPQEIYLGRDGIYAWVGRRAQDVARRRSMGLDARVRAKETGEVIDIKPKYLVYPRYYKDSLNNELRNEILQQEGITPESDPIFYDTGYVGSIPTQILNLMGYDPREVEGRIKLLSATNPRRRARNLHEDVPGEVIEIIEGHPKTTDAIYGIVRDSSTGKLRPFANPTSTAEQFGYLMIEQAITRHYWLRERLNYGPPDMVVTASGSQNTRILGGYTEVLPRELLENPDNVFQDSKDGVESGDSRLGRSVRLLDSTKTLMKGGSVRGIQDEFYALKHANRSGLPGLRPVGIILSNNEGTAYLLTESPKGMDVPSVYIKLTERYGENSPEVVDFVGSLTARHLKLIEQYRQQLNIDKAWRLEDLYVDFDFATNTINSLTPVNFARTAVYNARYPLRIESIIK